ncbi:type II secretion system protein [Candidatus Saccharibacteria bacterium]|nr:type II secretion system protein [Candidatus Saccharibacteria bacterium]
MKYTRAFTVIELLFVVVIVGVASIFFFIQKNDIETAARDDTRKTAINAMYYSLEEVYYENDGHYPQVLTSDMLPSVDADLFTDPFGIILGESDSDYRYEPTECVNDACESYTLRSSMESEDDFIRKSRN